MPVTRRQTQGILKFRPVSATAASPTDRPHTMIMSTAATFICDAEAAKRLQFSEQPRRPIRRTNDAMCCKQYCNTGGLSLKHPQLIQLIQKLEKKEFAYVRNLGIHKKNLGNCLSKFSKMFPNNF